MTWRSRTWPPLAVLFAAAAMLSGLGGVAHARSWKSCGGLAVIDGHVRTMPTIDLLHGDGGPRSAFFIQTQRAGCPSAQAVVAAVLQSDDEAIALASAGYRLQRVRHERDIDGHDVRSVQASHGSARLRYWRFGRRLVIDHTLYRAGQWLTVFGNAGNAFACTASWVLQPRAGGPPVGLTAGHCIPSEHPEDVPVARYIGTAGKLIGHIVASTYPQVDAATFSIDPSIGVAQEIERGSRAPLTVTGWVRTADQHRGDGVCFAGRTTGADQCGKIVKRFALVSKRQLCTNIRDAHGDSGGPVYTPQTGGRTRAMGIVSTAVTHGIRLHRALCYTPIEAILDAFGATLAPGGLVRGPGFPF